MPHLFLCVFLLWGGICFFPSSLFAKVKFEIHDPKSVQKSLKQACKLMKKNNLITKRESMAFFDCMGEKVSARSFCLEMMRLKKIPNLRKRSFLRGVVYKEGKALCQFGRSAILSFSLKDFKNETKDSIKLCKKLRKHYAFNLQAFHFYKGKGAKRSCYYSERDKI